MTLRFGKQLIKTPGIIDFSVLSKDKTIPIWDGKAGSGVNVDTPVKYDKIKFGIYSETGGVTTFRDICELDLKSNTGVTFFDGLVEEVLYSDLDAQDDIQYYLFNKIGNFTKSLVAQTRSAYDRYEPLTTYFDSITTVQGQDLFHTFKQG